VIDPYAEMKGRAEARLRNSHDTQDIASLRLALAQEQAESVRQLAQAQAREMSKDETLKALLEGHNEPGVALLQCHCNECVDLRRALASPASGWPAEVEVLRDFARSALVVLRARGEQKELIEGLAKSLVPFEGVKP